MLDIEGRSYGPENPSDFRISNFHVAKRLDYPVEELKRNLQSVTEIDMARTYFQQYVSHLRAKVNTSHMNVINPRERARVITELAKDHFKGYLYEVSPVRTAEGLVFESSSLKSSLLMVAAIEEVLPSERMDEPSGQPSSNQEINYDLLLSMVDSSKLIQGQTQRAA